MACSAPGQRRFEGGGGRMSDKADVIVIGGGVIGLSVAWRLAQAGATVTLVERGACGRQASWHAVGVLSPGNPNFKHSIAQMHLRSLDMQEDFCAELRERTGIDPEYHRCQRLEFCDGDQRYRMGLSEVKAAADRTMPDGSAVLEMLSPDEALALEPGMRRPAFGALLCRVSARVDNPRLLQALAGACRLAGVIIRDRTPVNGLAWQGDRVCGVRVGDETVEADHVVLAAGAWSSRLDARVADVIEVTPVRGQAVLLETDDPPFHRIIRKRNHYVVRRKDGRIVLGSTVEHDAGFELHNTAVGVQAMLDAAIDMIPSLADAHIADMWSGLRPCTPDWRPCIGPVPGAERLIAACGHFKTGLVFAPITARIVTDLVTQGATPFDLSRALPGRPMKQLRKRGSEA